MYTKPRVFIGSSSEGIKIASIVHQDLTTAFQPILWPELFVAKRNYIEVLEREAKGSDFAVLVATADDPIQIRGQDQIGMRDNVLFEFGLFSGAMGRAKTHILLPAVEKFRIPSDLTGVSSVAEYNNTTLTGKIEQIMGLISAQWLLRDVSEIQVNIKERAFRLLRFISWIRDGIAKSGPQSSEKYFLEVFAKFEGVSSFLFEDCEYLGISSSFEDLISSLRNAVSHFPTSVFDTEADILDILTHRRSLTWSAEKLFFDKLRDFRHPNENGFGFANDELDYLRSGRPNCFCELSESNDTTCPISYAYSQARIKNTQNSGYSSRSKLIEDTLEKLFEQYYYRYQYDGGRHRTKICVMGIMSTAWWSLGIVEVLDLLNSLRSSLKDWSNYCGDDIQKKLKAFEHELHEAIFNS